MSKPLSRSPEEVRTLLEGPVNSIPTPFLRDASIDWNGVGNIIETGISGGSRVSLLTVGDSQFLSLSGQEIAELTRYVVERVSRRALTVAATGLWPTRRAVEFAQFCRDLGADCLMTLPPAGASETEGLVGHYRAVAAVMPIMLVGAPAHAILDSLQDVPNICCFKEDGSEAYAIITLHKYGERWKIMTGGCLWRHLLEWPYGCRSFMAWDTCFAPRVSQEYWRHLQGGNLSDAVGIIRRIEIPLFTVSSEQPGGGLAGGGRFPGSWQGVWRAALELHGIAARHLRPPLRSASDEDIERLAGVLKQVGLRP
ncbi:MAG: dihydrodipicolinate synthase family protein [Planctomycetes bacterium]|nr:dihydrodipicolinate synthase family protein [Planctomycetota bacterium]